MNQVELKKRQVELVSYILGMVFWLILGGMLGENGVTYVAFAFESYLFFSMLINSRLADTLGKLIRGRMTRGQYKNAAKLRKNAMILEGIIGIAGALLVFAVAGLLEEKIFGLKYCTAMLRILAPAVLLRTVSSVLLGYFQGEGTELPTVISCLMRRICTFLFALLFIFLLGNYGQKVSALLRQENFIAMFSGFGLVLAILVSETLVTLFLFLVYRGSRGKERKGNGEGMRTTDTFGSQVNLLVASLLPLVFIVLLQHLPVWLGMFFYRRSVTELVNLNPYGVLYGKYLPLIVIFALPAHIFLLGNCYRTVSSLRKEEQRFARNHFNGGLHMGIIYGVFVAMFVAIMASPFAELICGQANEAAAQMLRFGSFLIPCLIAGFYFTEILLLSGGKIQVLVALTLKNIVYVVALLLFLNNTKAGILALIYAGLISEIIYMLAAGAVLCYQCRFNIDWLQHLAIPAGAACVTGLVLLFISRGTVPHLGSLAGILVCLVIGMACYVFLLLLIRNFRDQELNFIPGGKLIRMIGQALRIF